MYAALALAHALLAAAQHPLASSLPSVPSTASRASAMPAPPGCLRLKTDSDWPSKETWDAELQGWEVLPKAPPGAPRGQALAEHPDIMYEVRRVASVQRAVNFARRHRVRLSIISSGHDFLAR